jgi:DNA-binding response OmpR family regulator
MHDDENCRFITKNGIIKLTYSENHLLQVLIRNKGKVCKFSYRDIFNLRKRLKGEVEIKTRRNRGYYID